MSKTTYRLEIDTTLWRKFKAKCATEGKTMLEVITELISSYVKNGG